MQSHENTNENMYYKEEKKESAQRVKTIFYIAMFYICIRDARKPNQSNESINEFNIEVNKISHTYKHHSN